MRKEVLLAILIGISFGLIITFGVYHSRNSISEAQKNQSQDLVKNQLEQNNNENNGQLAINSPDDELLTDNQQLIVSGTTGINNFVVIFVNNQETITHADDAGNFSVEVELDEGGNILIIQSIDEDGQSCQLERTVIVDNEFFNEEFLEASEGAEIN